MAPLYHVKPKSRLDGGSMHPPSARCRKRLPSPACCEETPRRTMSSLRNDEFHRFCRFEIRWVTSVRQSASDSQSVSYFTVPPRAHPSSELFRRQYLSEGGGI